MPDFAVLDFILAGEHVTPVALRLRELGVPFVLTSAYPNRDTARPALERMANLGKPPNTTMLIHVISRVIGR